MIVPMKKVSLVVLKNGRKEALQALRRAGVMHLLEVQGADAELTALRAEYTKLENALIFMEEVKAPKKIAITSPELSRVQAIEKACEITALFTEKKAFEEEILKNGRELERLAAWGSINPADLTLLRTKGINIALYEAPATLYARLPDTLKTIFVNQDKTQCRFILIEATEQRPTEMPPEAYAVPMPEKSTVQLKAEIETAQKRITELSIKIGASLLFCAPIKKALEDLSKNIVFSNVFHGMEKEADEHLHALAWLTGFVPIPQFEPLKVLAAKENWALQAVDPSEDDDVPTQLKNSKLVQLLYPLLDFLGTVPGYREFDISAWFLFFFSIFFAMIFGDAGYGTLLLIIGLVGVFSAMSKKKPVPLVMQLVILLAVATMIWGTLTCSWFGIAPDKLPPFFRTISLWAFSNVNPESSTNIQIFCFTLALTQLSIGHIVALLRNIKIKSLKMFADIGSLGILWGMFNIVLNLLVSAERFPMTNVTFGLIGGGFTLSFVFSNYEGSIGKSILSSLTNIISVLLGVINFFSDIVSYIRLWAVGLAGAAIAQTVNTMAGPLLGNFLLFLGVLLLVFGHGLNMMLNVLSVIVHGVRLNTLEFTSHVGMAWSGFKYEPFKE